MRLTQEMIRKTHQNALSGAYQDDFDRAKKMGDVAAYRIYLRLTKELHDKLSDSLLKHFVAISTRCTIVLPRVKGEVTQAWSIENGEFYRPANSQDWHGSYDLNQEPFNKVKVPLKDLQQLRDAYNLHMATRDAYNSLSSRVQGILHSVNTIKQLVEIWPEAAHYLPIVPSTSKALVVSVDDVQKELAHAKHRKSAG